jgi:hypothetical protein
MNGESTNRMQCTEFETLLAEAVEGRLNAAQDADFRAHARGCTVCGPMLADALAGFELLHTLAEVEPPRNLVHNILVRTSGVTSVRNAAEKAPLADRLREWLRPVLIPMLQPRVAGSLAMGFFSLTLILSLAGFKVSDLKHIDLRPSAIRQGLTRQYYETSARVVKYYDNMRLVYETQARFGELKNQITPAEQNQQPSQEKKQKNDKNITRRPQPKREQDYYSQRATNMKLASLEANSAAPHSTWKRRDA